LSLSCSPQITKRAIGYELSDKEWDFKKGEAKQNHAINTKINNPKSRLTDIQYFLLKKAIHIKRKYDSSVKTIS